MSGKKFSFIIVAGGKGSRMGNEKKQFALLNNKPLWQWSAERAAELKDSGIAEIILVIPADSSLEEEEKFSLKADIPFKVTRGGSERAGSVLNGLREAECEYVLVHDAARPFASKKIFLDLIEKTNEDTGAIPLLPVADALKKKDALENISCVERDGLFITQTPQSFPREKLIAAVEKNLNAKDEAEAWLEAGHKLVDVKGDRNNFKITWPEDLSMAKKIAEQKIIRTGIGYDVHPLVPERKLILGGVLIPSLLGLLGNSDADLLTHSVMDSILGAAGLDDIGTIFPASGPEYKNADSVKLLQKVLELVESEGWQVNFVDAVVQAQVPRLNKYRDEIRNNLGKFFAFNLKFKSAENLDDSGRGLSMTSWSVATLERKD